MKREVSSELLYYLEREYRKLEVVFQKAKFKCDKEIETLVKSYWEDCKYFYDKKDYIKAFELVNYIWGMLDILANLKMIEVPDEIKRWFKAEF